MIKMSGWLPVLDTLFFGGGGGRNMWVADSAPHQKSYKKSFKRFWG